MICPFRSRVNPSARFGQPLRQVRPLDVLHDQIIAFTLRKVRIDVGYARMLERRQHTRLALKALYGLAPLVHIRRIIVLDHLFDHAHAVKGLGVRRQVHRSHPAFTQRLDDAVRPAVHGLPGLQRSALVQEHATVRAKAGARLVRSSTRGALHRTIISNHTLGSRSVAHPAVIQEVAVRKRQVRRAMPGRPCTHLSPPPQHPSRIPPHAPAERLPADVSVLYPLFVRLTRQMVPSK